MCKLEPEYSYNFVFQLRETQKSLKCFAMQPDLSGLLLFASEIFVLVLLRFYKAHTKTKISFKPEQLYIYLYPHKCNLGKGDCFSY